MADFERVIDLAGYYDGPREGLAYFDGQPHAFKSRLLDVYGDNETIDIFDLTPVGASSPTMAAHAEFRRVGSGPLALGEWPVLEVRWLAVQEDRA